MAQEAYLRQRARLCRELADWISNNADAQQLRSMGAQYDHEADVLEWKNSEKATRAAASSDPDPAS